MALGEILRNARLARKLTPSQVAAATRMKVQTVEALEQEDFSRIAAPIYAKGFIRLYATYVGVDPRPLIEEFAARVANEERPSVPAAEPPPPAAAPPPEAPPAPEAPAEPEPDLFSARRRTFTQTGADEPEHELRSKPAEGEEGPRFRGLASKSGVSIPRMLRSLAWAVSEKWSKTGAAVVEKSRDLADSVREQPFELPTLRVPTAPLRVLSIAIGIVIVLVFVASVLSRCVRHPAANGRTAARNTVEELNLAVEPSDAYVD